jgi:3-hydroxyisobutyrate dehydrogenase-like beta-hydroxyacid dehydrogenase
MRIALIGYGEVGQILAEDLRAAAHVVATFDVKLLSPAREPLREHALRHGVTLAESHAEAVGNAELVVCAVTASETVNAARACAGALPAGSYFVDFNSASPGAKVTAAEQVRRGSSARYVEAAVMGSIPPQRMKVPLLLGGPDAAEVAPLLGSLGFVAKVVSDRLGVASATKMCRSVVVKGLEAMLIESLTAARHYGVEAEVIASLAETFPGIDWERQAAYFFQRVIEHGRRRSEEMREAAVTVRDAGLEPWSAAGTAERQAWIADLATLGVFGEPRSGKFARSADFRIEADRIRDHLTNFTKP